MKDETLETGVDKLLRVLKEKKRLSLSDTAKEMSLSEDIVETWANFLMEEGLITIEYKFTTPYLNYIVKTDNKQENSSYKIDQPEEKQRYEYKWKEEMMNTLESKKDFFIDHAEKKGFKDVESLWKEYKEKIANEF